MKKMNRRYGELVDGIGTVLEQGRKRALQSLHQTMTKTYWKIGKRIVEYEQKKRKMAKKTKQHSTRYDKEI